MLAAAQKVSLQLGNGGELEQVAAAIKQQIEAFVSAHDGSQLAALDGLIPDKYHYSDKYR
jgi:hypothetical protein